MATTLTFNSSIRDSVLLIQNGEAAPVLDYENTRYLVDISLIELGTIGFVLYDRTTKQPLGYGEQYQYGAQSTFRQAILGPGPRVRVAVRDIPPYPEVPPDDPPTGSVIPNYLL